MGSTTPTEKITKRKDYIEINSVNACAISGNKILMKERFTHGKIPTAIWFRLTRRSVEYNKEEKKFFCSKVNCALNKYNALIAKRYNSSGGKGIYLISTPDDFHKFFTDENFCNSNRKELENYIFEKYYTYSREYRIHVTKDGCFLADRKMLLDDATERWHRHENNSVWISENNELFDKPSNWNDIVNSCVNALKSVNLDIAAFDVKVQNSKHKYPKWIILESNSAPGLGENSLEAYKETILHIING